MNSTEPDDTTATPWVLTAVFEDNAAREACLTELNEAIAAPKRTPSPQISLCEMDGRPALHILCPGPDAPGPLLGWLASAHPITSISLIREG